jgi:hypothetical protein
MSKALLRQPATCPADRQPQLSVVEARSASRAGSESEAENGEGNPD